MGQSQSACAKSYKDYNKITKISCTFMFAKDIKFQNIYQQIDQIVVTQWVLQVDDAWLDLFHLVSHNTNDLWTCHPITQLPVCQGETELLIHNSSITKSNSLKILAIKHILFFFLQIHFYYNNLFISRVHSLSNNSKTDYEKEKITYHGLTDLLFNNDT